MILHILAAAPAGLPTPLPTTVQGWTIGAYGQWAVAVQLAILLGVIARFGPKWIEAKRDSRRMAAEDEREDAKIKAAGNESLLARVQALEDRAQKAETIAMCLTGAVTQALNALKSVDPTNTAISQANNLIEMAISAGGDNVFAKSLAKLATVKGVGE